MNRLSMDDMTGVSGGHYRDKVQRGGFLVTRETTPAQRELFEYANRYSLTLAEAKPRLDRDKKEEALRKEREEREAPYRQRMAALEAATTFEELKPILADIISYIWEH